MVWWISRSRFSIKKLRSNRKNALYGALIVAAGIVLNRFDVTWFALKPLHGIYYYPSFIEISLLVGVVAGVIVVYALVAHFFPLFSETMSVNELPLSERVALQLAPSVAED